MMTDKRKAPRRAIRYTAWCKLKDGTLHGCALSDISDVGSRLDVEDAKNIPDEFILLLSSRGSPKRKCRVVWRADNQLGVEFERPLTRTDKTNGIGRAMENGRSKPEPEAMANAAHETEMNKPPVETEPEPA